MAEDVFRELRGDYVANVGQVVTPREYLDYLEPLGSALSRRPDGVGGPFVYQFRGSGGRVIGAMGWVVSAASKRYGGWNLWGVWTEGPIPALALPLFWTELQDASQLPGLLRRANDDAASLRNASAWPDLLDQVDPTPLNDDDLRSALKVELSRLYRLPHPQERPIEVDLDASSLELLPWIHLLGPIDPAAAQLQPSRFNGTGYQYILTDSPPAGGDVVTDIARMVDATASDVLQGWRMASALRERRARPKPATPRKQQRPPVESIEMATPSRSKPVPAPAPRPQPNPLSELLPLVRDVMIVALLAWIAFNVHQIRRNMTNTAATQPAATVTAAETEAEPEPAAPPPTREELIAEALLARPPQGIRMEAAAAKNLPHTAVEIFMRRNNCFARTEPVDGKFSTAELRAMRNCKSLAGERLMRNATEPHAERSLAWLENAVSAQ
ncbi:MAG TPA: hypothetical protein VEK11_22385 [Thermoanaerobaculia bacterium]|nr:hypothetical protein [Thermoanaerobaculia bacterium]